jgi:hypothetical protein
MKAGLVFAIVLLAALGCADKPEQPADPTAPPVAQKSASAPTPVPMRGATVCLSYGRDRELVRSKLKKTPADAKLQKELKSLDDLILDAC